MGDYYIYIVDISRFSSLPAGKIPTGYLHKTFVDDPVPALIKRSFTSPLPTAEDSALARATTTTTPNLVFIKLVFLLPSPSFPFPLFCTLSLSPPSFFRFRFAFSRKLAEVRGRGGGEEEASVRPLSFNRNRYADPWRGTSASQRKLARASDDSTMPLIIIRHWRNTWRARGPICRHVFTRSMGFRRWRGVKGCSNLDRCFDWFFEIFYLDRAERFCVKIFISNLYNFFTSMISIFRPVIQRWNIHN